MQIASREEPHERSARAPSPARASLTLQHLDPGDAALRAALGEWERLARSLLGAGDLDAETRSRLADDLRIVEELSNVLAGAEPGEGRADERQVVAVHAAGRLQGVCSYFECTGGVFIELLATAPWNLLRHAGARDPRGAKGVGAALLAHAVELSRDAGHGGRLALQAENPRCLEHYLKLGFAPMAATDDPFSLVPRGERGWSAPVLRLARGQPGPEEQAAPWLVLDPARSARAERRAA
jgi:GNAT superfamily N-acetyltransferase